MRMYVRMVSSIYIHTLFEGNTAVVCNRHIYKYIELCVYIHYRCQYETTGIPCDDIDGVYSGSTTAVVWKAYIHQAVGSFT